MPGILPEITAGGLVYRDATGAPTNPPEVERAYVPAPAFLSTCELTALPSNCDARIEPRQINAIVSELLSFAECINPTGTWNCGSLQNLCTAFTAWAAINISGVIVADTAPASAQDSALWWESDTGHLFINYNDGNTTQWVQITNDAPFIDNVSIVGAGLASSPFAVGLVDCGVY